MTNSLPLWRGWREGEAVSNIPDGARCCATVHRDGGLWRGSPCSKRAQIEVGGRYYCGIHDPAAVARRRGESNARSAAYSAYLSAKWKAEDARRVVLNAAREALRQKASWEAVEVAGAAMLAAEDAEKRAAQAHADLQPSGKKNAAA